MPPMIRFDRSAVLSAALELTRKSGLTALNARAVAREMGSSTQPIFRLFSGMEELKAEVIAMIQSICKEAIHVYTDALESPFLSRALGYVMFAQKEPQFFKILFLSDAITENDLIHHILCLESAHVDDLQQRLGFSRETTIRAMQWIWIFTQGMAVSCCVTRQPIYTDEQAKCILVHAMETVKQQMGRSLR